MLALWLSHRDADGWSLVSPRKFDRYMVGLGAGRHVKLRRLTVPERYAFFLGVLSLAAQSPVRGCLMVGSMPVEPADVAAACGVSEKVAASALVKLREVGMVYKDDDLDCERVHDFDDWNPEPRVGPLDANGGRRQALFRDADLRALIRERDQDLCRYCGVEVKWNDRRGPYGGTYDHVEPDGPNADWNLVVACRGCNSSKGSRTPDQAGIQLRPEPKPRSDLAFSTQEVEVEEEVEEKKNLAASPPRARAQEADSRSRAETVACPRCGAVPGEKCDGERGKRESCHLERHHAVGELAHISGKTKQSRFAAPVSLAWSPPAEDVALRDEHFPDWSIEAVSSSASQLRLGRKPVTVEAVRGLLTGEEAA